MKENVLIRGSRGRRGRWGEDPGNLKPIDPSRLPEGYPYKEAIEDVILTERTIEIAWNDASSIYRCDLEVENRIALVAGQEYCVVWNGKEYRAVCGADSLGIAQLTITTEDGTVTFQNWASGYYVKCSYDCGGTATVAIKHCYEVTHRIEPTLLPDGYPYKETVEKAVLDNVALESADGYKMAYGITAYGDLSESDSVTVAAVEDMLSFENITVIFDGTEHHYTVADAEHFKAYVDGSTIEIGIFVGNRWLQGKSEGASDEILTESGVTDTGEPFCLMLPYLSGKEGTVYAEDGENHTITVKLWNEVTHTMAEEFLPESVKGGGGAEVLTVTFSGANVANTNAVPDVTFDELKAAYDAGKIIKARYVNTTDNNIYELATLGYQGQYDQFHFLIGYYDASGYGTYVLQAYIYKSDNSIVCYMCCQF